MPNRSCFVLPACFVLVSFPLWRATQSACAAEPSKPAALADEMIRLPFVEPDQAPKTFELQRDFSVELVVSEPAIGDPVDACFDEFGRMYVAEMHGYPYSSEPTKLFPKGGGKKDAGIIRLLQDTTGDGRMDRSVVFADKISWATSVCCWRGGVFVVAPPHVHYFKDTDGDEQADVREIVFSGLSRDNVQGLSNNLKWGLDNRIYFAGGTNGGKLEHRGKALGSYSGRDISFDPRTEAVEFVSGGSQFGHSKNNWGDRFVSSNSNHIQHVVYENRYLARNPYLAISGVRRTIAKGGAAAPVFRKSPPEPWRIVRTRRRVADPKYKNLPATERVATGFFTSATGVTIYRGDAYPEEFHGNAFIGDVGGNMVHRKTMTPKGASFVAARADQNIEFLTSTDTWFRPVNFVNAPDGTLLVLDMYRETIEHPYSIPEDIKAHLDLESGDNRGRIWRLVSPGMKRRPFANLGNDSAEQLVARLESDSGWTRDTAQRLLVERGDKSAVSALEQLVRSSQEPLARLHALYSLDGLGELKVPTLLIALDDADAHVREHAIRLCEQFADRDEELIDSLLAQADDDAYRVRYQLAYTLGSLHGEKAVEGLRRLAPSTAVDRDMRTAWLTSVADRTTRLCLALLKDTSFIGTPPAIPLLAELYRIEASKKKTDGSLRLLTAVVASEEPFQFKQHLVKALGEGLSRHGSSIPKLVADAKADEPTRKRIQSLFNAAVETIQNDRAPLDERRGAIGLLAFTTFETASNTLSDLLDPVSAPALQLAAVQALAEHDHADVGKQLIGAWRGFSPTLRGEVVDAMLSRIGRTQILLASVESGLVKRGEINRDKKQLLENHPNEKVRIRARKLFGAEVSSDRANVVSVFQKALELQGSTERGQKVYAKHCSVCHKLGDVGHQVGPDLASTKNKSPRDLLISILDPNREAQPTYTTYTVVTEAGKLYNGIIASETAGSITLRRAEGKQDVILRENIGSLVSNGISLMPNGLEKEVTVEQMADLIEFVKSIKPAEKKTP